LRRAVLLGVRDRLGIGRVLPPLRDGPPGRGGDVEFRVVRASL